MNIYKIDFYASITKMMTIEIEGESEDEACDKFYEDLETNFKLADPIKGSVYDNIDAEIHEILLLKEGDDD